MKTNIITLLLLTFFITSCGNNSEIEQLKKENALLAQQVKELKTGTTAKGPKYILKLKLKQAHFSLNIKKHVKDAINSLEFEIPVDKEFYDSVSEGTELVDKFRLGSLILDGNFGDWEVTVEDKKIR